MLRCCEICTEIKGLTYEEQTHVCGKCRECKKVDLVPHAEKPEYFKGKRWTGGRVSQFTEDTKKAIRTLYWESNLTQAELGKMFGVGQKTISNIVKKKGVKKNG